MRRQAGTPSRTPILWVAEFIVEGKLSAEVFEYVEYMLVTEWRPNGFDGEPIRSEAAVVKSRG